MKKYSIFNWFFIVFILCIFFQDTYSQVSGEWTEIHENGYNPPDRAGHSTIYRSISNEIVICGGFGGPSVGYLEDTHAYSIDSNQWSELPIAPFSGYNKAIYDPLNDRMIVKSWLSSSYVYEFNFFTEQWIQHRTSGDIPLDLDFPSAAYNSITHCMIIHAGEWVGSNDTYSLDLNTMVWELLNVSGELPLETKHQAAVFDSINEVLIVFGGQTQSPTEYLNETFVLDMNTNIWTKKDTLQPIPTARSHVGYDYSYNMEKMIIMGGYIPGASPPRTNDTWLYDLQSDSWEEVLIEGELPHERHNHSTICIEDANRVNIYVIAGYPYGNTDIWRLDFSIPVSTLSNVSSCSDNSITIYPNPSTGVFNLTADGFYDEIDIIVLNLKGQKVLQEKRLGMNGNSKYNIDISSSPPGLYFVKLIINNTSYYRKVIVCRSY